MAKPSKGRWALFATHPGVAFRRPAELGPLSAHIEGFARRVERGIPADPVICLEPSAYEVAEFTARVLKAGVRVGVDIETGSPKLGRPEWGRLPGVARLKSIAIGADIENGIGLAWMWPISSGAQEPLKALLANTAITKVFQNGFHFDLPVLARYKIHVKGPVEDIRDARRALSSTSKLSLEALAGYYLDVPSWKGMVDWSAKDDD